MFTSDALRDWIPGEFSRFEIEVVIAITELGCTLLRNLTIHKYVHTFPQTFRRRTHFLQSLECKFPI